MDCCLEAILEVVLTLVFESIYALAVAFFTAEKICYWIRWTVMTALMALPGVPLALWMVRLCREENLMLFLMALMMALMLIGLWILFSFLMKKKSAAAVKRHARGIGAVFTSLGFLFVLIPTVRGIAVQWNRNGILSLLLGALCGVLLGLWMLFLYLLLRKKKRVAETALTSGCNIPEK